MKERAVDKSARWIANFPDQWEIKPIRFVADIQPKCNRGRFKPNDIVTFLPMDHVKNGYYHNNDALFVDDNASYTSFENGDIIMAKVTPCFENGNIAVAENLTNGYGYGSSELYVFRTKQNFYNRFLFYWLQNDHFLKTGVSNMNGSAGLKRVPMSFVKYYKVTVPPFYEQIAISNLLDQFCSEISASIDSLELQIELLQEYKKSLITETVTKGLNPNVPMKDSGIQWIGEIPEHWEVKKIKHIATYIGSGTTPDTGITEYYDGSINWIQSGDLYKRDRIFSTEKTVTNLALKTFSTLKVYKQPFVTVAMYGASVGNVAISQIDACVNQACCVILPAKTHCINFLYYWLTACKQDFDIKAIGGGQPNISQQIIKNQYYLSTPREEQQVITAFLDQRCAEIDSIIDGKLKQIQAQKEYKEALINEYVTGKKRVKEVN